MLYLANPSSPPVRDAMRAGILGQMVTPAEGRKPIDGVEWAADNGCFSKKGYPGDEKWLTWLESLLPWAGNCLFAVAPDLFNPDLSDDMGLASLERSRPWLPLVRGLGFPVALVAQNGLLPEDVPWDEIDWLFLGGTTEWKLSASANRLVHEANRRDVKVHMGRVNSARRWKIAEVFGCTTCDGTFIAIAPDTNLERQGRWADSNLFGDAA